MSSLMKNIDWAHNNYYVGNTTFRFQRYPKKRKEDKFSRMTNITGHLPSSFWWVLVEYYENAVSAGETATALNVI